MPSQHGQPNGGPRPAGGEEPPYFVITLYTWLDDEVATVNLAQRVAEIVGSMPEIDQLATTVSLEEGAAAEPVKVYADIVNGPGGS